MFNQINVHGFFMEYDTERAGGFEPLRLLPRARSWCWASSPPRPASSKAKDDAEAPHRPGREFAPLDQLCLSPQCGFASTEEGNALTEDEQWAKLAPDRRGGRRGLGPAEAPASCRHRPGLPGIDALA